MANYTIDTPSILQSGRTLDSPGAFPPVSAYRTVFTPKPGEMIQAAQFRKVTFELSLFGLANSHTQWPSRFQLTAPGLGGIDTTTISGYKEFHGIYKVVFEDSTNPTNDVNWDFGVIGNANQVYMWIYFGKNETTPIDSLIDMTIDLDVDYNPYPFTLSETTSSGPAPALIINNFNI